MHNRIRRAVFEQIKTGEPFSNPAELVLRCIEAGSLAAREFERTKLIVWESTILACRWVIEADGLTKGAPMPISREDSARNKPLVWKPKGIWTAEERAFVLDLDFTKAEEALDLDLGLRVLEAWGRVHALVGD